MKRLSAAALMVVFAICAIVVMQDLGVIRSANRAAANGAPAPQVVAAEANTLLREWSYPGAWDDPQNPVARETEKVSPREGLVWTRCLATRDKPGQVWRYYLKEFGMRSGRDADPSRAKSVVGSFDRSIPSGSVDVAYSFRPGQKFTQIVVKVIPPGNTSGPSQPAPLSGLQPLAPAKT